MESLWRAERRNTLIAWPDAVNERLDQLVAAGIAAGENINRSHLLAALVVHADLSPEFVAGIMRDYRALNSNALDEANRSAAEQWPAVRRPGPRRDSRRSKTGGARLDSDPSTTNDAH
ncbi:hypothetical protein [Streptomyces sp. NBC_01268]|uniref:hypothetical protein n=1 Tax=Streptomyces sp. NBC_01268 TaxID=2903806 RepID=UPI002E32A7B6|nr:hypothetical protein [Streptomyces sp. NBC_01268]